MSGLEPKALQEKENPELSIKMILRPETKALGLNGLMFVRTCGFMNHAVTKQPHSTIAVDYNLRNLNSDSVLGSKRCVRPMVALHFVKISKAWLETSLTSINS